MPTTGVADHNDCGCAKVGKPPPTASTSCPVKPLVFVMSISSQDETAVRIAPTAIDKSDQRVRRMFGSIARRYDFLNHLLSLNIDRSWRAFTTRVVAPVAGMPILDCCTGTADLALAYDRAGGGLSPIIGTDFCREMLVLGHEKARKAGATGRVTLALGDTQRLPVPSDTFGIVSVAFGLRNVRDTIRGVDEMIRVARPGGTVAILEFSRPRGRLLGPLYLAFFRHLLPRLGQARAQPGECLRVSAP